MLCRGRVSMFAADPVLAAVGLHRPADARRRQRLLPAQDVAAGDAAPSSCAADVSDVAHESFEGALVVKTLGREAEETERFAARADRLRGRQRRRRADPRRVRAGHRGAADARHPRRARRRHRPGRLPGRSRSATSCRSPTCSRCWRSRSGPSAGCSPSCRAPSSAGDRVSGRARRHGAWSTATRGCAPLDGGPDADTRARRPSTSTGSTTPYVDRGRRARHRLRRRHARRRAPGPPWPSSARPGRASRRWPGCWCGSSTPRDGTVLVTASTCATSPRRRSPRPSPTCRSRRSSSTTPSGATSPSAWTTGRAVGDDEVCGGAAPGAGRRLRRGPARRASTPGWGSAAPACPAASASASPSPGPWCAGRGCSCSTTPPAPSTPPSSGRSSPGCGRPRHRRDGITVVVVAYRRSTIALADQVVHVEHGRVVDRGTHADAGGAATRRTAPSSRPTPATPPTERRGRGTTVSAATTRATTAAGGRCRVPASPPPPSAGGVGHRCAAACSCRRRSLVGHLGHARCSPRCPPSDASSCRSACSRPSTPAIVARPGGPATARVVLLVAVAAVAVLVTAVCAYVVNVRLFRATEAGLATLRTRAFRRIHDLSTLTQNTERRGALVSRVTSDVDTISTFVQFGGLILFISLRPDRRGDRADVVYSWWLALLVWAASCRCSSACARCRGCCRPLRPGPRERRRHAGAVSRVRRRRRHHPRLRAPSAAPSAASTPASRSTAATPPGRVSSPPASSPPARSSPAWPSRAVVGVGALVRRGRRLDHRRAARLPVPRAAVHPAGADRHRDAQRAAERPRRLATGDRRARHPRRRRRPRRRAGCQADPAGPVDGARSRASPTPTPDGPPRAARRSTWRSRAQARVAVVGETGSGKTTLAKLLTRLQDPAVGRVLLNGVDLRDVPFASLRRRVVARAAGGLPVRRVAAGEHPPAPGPAATDDDVDLVVTELGLQPWVRRVCRTAWTPGSGSAASRCRPGSGSSWRWPGPTSPTPTCSCSTRPPRPSTPPPRCGCSAPWTASPAGRTSVAIAHRLSTAEAADLVVVVDAGRVVETGHPRRAGPRRAARTPACTPAGWPSAAASPMEAS